MTTLLLGLDISTTGAKALLINTQGKVVASYNSPHPISNPKPLWSEQNPEHWWDGIRMSIQNVLQKVGHDASIAAIGLTGQMHGLVCLDTKGNVLRPAILWNDQRTQFQCDWITSVIGEKRLIELTGNRALTGFTAPKIIWVRENEPEIYSQIAHVLLPKDYIRYKLTGNFCTDLAGASGTLLLDVKQRKWSQEVLEALAIPQEWMPKVHEGIEQTGVVQNLAATLTGLETGTPVVGGGGDQAAQAVGVGSVKPGIVALTLGTSGVVFAPLASYSYEPEGRLHAFCHALPDQYHFMGVMLSAAGSLQWYRDTFFPNLEFTSLLQEATDIAPGAEGLLFLPYLSGERTPHPDPLARGAFVGLTNRHTRAHMTRAVLEGIAFGLCDSFQLIQNSTNNISIQEIRVSGGGAQSPLWLSILSSILNEPLVTVEAIEGAAYGAALLAGLNMNYWDDISTLVPTGSTIMPQEEQVGVYEHYYQLYQSLYPALSPHFKQLSTLAK